MKQLFMLVGISCLFATCKKSDFQKSTTSQNDLINAAQSYFSENLKSLPLSSLNQRTASDKIPIWEKATVIQLSIGNAVIAPLQYAHHFYLKSPQSNILFDINEIAQLLIMKDSTGAMHGEVITSFPDSNFEYMSTGKFTGMMFIEDWSGNSISKLKFDQGGVQMSGATNTSNRNISVDGIIPDDIIETCFEISGYNYSPSDPDGGESWTESAGCSYSIMVRSDGGGGGGASGGDYGGVGARTRVTPLVVNVFVGTNPITNIQQWIKCFTSSASSDHTYTVSVCVDQPDPGTRTPWTLTGTGSVAAGNIVNVGHTFLIFNESYPGNSIVRNIGFYPSTNVSPGYHSTTQGMLNDDAAHPYNIQAVYTVNNTQFFQILNYAALGNNTGFSYDLSTNNCTTFGIRSMAAGDITLPSTIGTWAGGAGNDPGDLGEDLLRMGSSPGVSVNTSQGNHPDVGWCN